MSRTDVPTSWDERTMLATFLDYARETVHAKCEGVTDEHARKAPLTDSPLMTISGLVSHLRWVEYSWIETVLLGRDDEGPWTEQEPDRDMSMAVGMPIVRLLDDYGTQCEAYRELVAVTDLDTRAERPLHSGETVTLRWILMHLIEETARHNGHLDILRELADGVTGD